MTVAQMIERLRRFPSDAVVYVVVESSYDHLAPAAAEEIWTFEEAFLEGRATTYVTADGDVSPDMRQAVLIDAALACQAFAEGTRHVWDTLDEDEAWRDL